jgi:hypothetical protein
MGIPLLIIFFTAIVFIYYLVVRGWLWKIALALGGTICMWLVFSEQPGLRATAFVVGGLTVSWAAAVPLGLLFLALLTSKGD